MLIRMALRAQKNELCKMVIGQGLKFVLMGVPIGIVIAVALTRFLSSLLYGVKPTDPLTFAAVSLLLSPYPRWRVAFRRDGQRKSIRWWR